MSSNSDELQVEQVEQVHRVERRQVLRLLDANLNRAAEGLRTLEDLCRLVFEHEGWAARLKDLRHQLTSVGEGIPRTERLAARDTARDAGTGASTQGETQRETWLDIIAAGCERSSQALRCLEEFSKLLSPDMAAAFKALRYRAYDDLAGLELSLVGEQAHNQGLRGEERSRWQRLQQARLYLLIGCERPIDEFTRLLVELAEAGVDCFQLRDKQADGRTLIEYATAAVDSLRDSSALFVVNDRIDIAQACGADGVHVGQEDIELSMARRLLGPSKLIGVSTHDLRQAWLAVEGGSDYVGCGPTFPSKTKAFGHFPGLAFLREVSQAITVPAFAIGGIELSNLQQVAEAGIARIAVSHAILGASSPVQAAQLLSQQLATAAEQLHDTAPERLAVPQGGCSPG